MKLVNPSTWATKPIDNGFEGRAEGLTYTGTADDPQLLRVWGNILNQSPTSGMYSAILKDMSSGVTATSEKVTIADGAATMPATNGWWWNGILLAKGAYVTIPCIGWYSDEDWQVMQALHVICFAKDTAAY
ncbi:hypothetical protein NBH13_01720 [Bifidobacterium sp. M3-R-103]|uniref:hypothetical protein n=1 Tax=Bifidobacterium sp. M3-R-103 TaxID=2949652 RepID=UPI00202E72F6|nr:hypothetical protein [Bifidobacterium sp. M3-R-103]MCM0691966.1 hypothetical protein [Bifidobacterium sp. M3-R-103]